MVPSVPKYSAAKDNRLGPPALERILAARAKNIGKAHNGAHEDSREARHVRCPPYHDLG